MTKVFYKNIENRISKIIVYTTKLLTIFIKIYKNDRKTSQIAKMNCIILVDR